MGVRGLKGFVDNNSDKLKRRYRLWDTSLVIDGMNLVFSLYRRSALDVDHHLYGGDYNRFSDTVREFFRTLDSCGVRALVIFDGNIDQSDSKKKTRIDRFEQTLTIAAKISGGDLSVTKEVLGPLYQLAVEEILTRLTVPHVEASHEADGVIARIANHFQCPVLSDDSDFFIFDLKGGVISTEELVKSLTVKTDPNDPKQRYLDCELYLIGNLIEYFPGLRKDVLPFFATVMGNDYLKGMDYLFGFIPRPRRQTSKHLTIKERHRNLATNLNRLRNCRINDLLSLFDQQLDDTERDLLTTSLRTYDTDLSVGTHDLPTDGQKLLERLVQSFDRNTVVSEVHSKKYDLLRPRVEDHRLPSSNASSRQLRRYWLGLTRVGNKDLEPTRMYDRMGSKKISYRLWPLLQTPEGLPLPDSHGIVSLSDSNRRYLMYGILSIDDWLEQNISDAIDDLRTAETLGLIFSVIVMRYWISHCAHDVWLEFVFALLASIVCSGYVGNYTDIRFVCLDESDGRVLTDRLKPFNVRPKHNLKPYEPRIVHFFTEYQNCLRLIRKINKKFDSVLPIGSLFHSLNGVFIYNLTVRLTTSSDPRLMMSKILASHPSIVEVFDKILDQVIYGHKNVVRCPTLTNQKTRRQSNRSRSCNRSPIEQDCYNGSDYKICFKQRSRSHSRRSRNYDKSLGKYAMHNFD